MKILLDEYVDRKVRNLLKTHEVITVPQMGLQGIKNGELLVKAVELGFDILLTIDKNIDSQQKIGKFNLTLVVFDVLRNHVKSYEELVSVFENRVTQMNKGKVYIISKER